MLAPGLWIVGAIVGLVLGLVNAFKKEPSPPLILLYAAAQGVFLGGISQFYEVAVYDGHRRPGGPRDALGVRGLAVPVQSGKVRVTPKFQRIAAHRAWSATCVFSLVNVVLMLFGIAGDGFGPLRAGWLGVAVGLVARRCSPPRC